MEGCEEPLSSPAWVHARPGSRPVRATSIASSALGTFNDEFNSRVTFVSPGLLALANRGDDTNDTGFFITDTKAGDQQHQDLNFNYTIFGQLVSGFDIYQDIMGTKTAGLSPLTTLRKAGGAIPITVNG